LSRPLWRHLQVLVVGAMLAPGRRTVSAARRAVGRRHLPTCPTDHRVLNRAAWSSLAARRVLLGRLVATSAGDGPLVSGIAGSRDRCAH
jgi:hypothetical protein